MREKLIFYLILFLTIAFYSKGQINDSSKVSLVNTFNVDTFFFQAAKNDPVKIDTTISSIHQYIPVDSLIAFQYLGNAGLAFKKSNFNINEYLCDCYQFNKNFRYFLENKSLIVARKRFTSLQYVLGSKKEQFLTVLHSQNIFQGFNASIKYQRLSSEGFLRRQNTKLSQFEFFPWFETKNHNYSIYGSINVKDYQLEENGGIGADTAASDLTDLNLLEINLLNAENRTRKFSSSISQKLNFDQFDETGGKFKHTIAHRISYSEEKNSYIDSEPTNEFYVTIYYDTSITNDVLKIIHLNNILQYSLQPSSASSISVYALNDILKVEQRSIDTSLNNSITGAEISFSKPINLTIKGEYCFSGPSEGNYLLSSTLNFELLNNYQFNLTYLNKFNYPDLFFRIFQSNHFSWYNFLKQIRTENLEFSMRSKEINTSIFFKFLTSKNYTFLNEAARPEQLADKLNYTSIQLKNLLKFGKFGFETNGVWQQVNNEAVVNLPEWAVKGTLFFESKLFNNALQTKAGIEGHYLSSFTGDKYMPPLRQFYLQNEIEVAGFTQLDVFINFKVKTARVFLKIENITSEGGDNFYYTVPGYPMAGRVFKLGINWMFFD